MLYCTQISTNQVLVLGTNTNECQQTENKVSQLAIFFVDFQLVEAGWS